MKLPGINIQSPWSKLIAEGKKTIETRKYKIPLHYLGVELAIIETAGRAKNRLEMPKATIIGTVIFSHCFEYKNKTQWQLDNHLHLISPTDLDFRFVEGKPKWAWVVDRASLFDEPKPGPVRKGIVFARECSI